MAHLGADCSSGSNMAAEVKRLARSPSLPLAVLLRIQQRPPHQLSLPCIHIQRGTAIVAVAVEATATAAICIVVAHAVCAAAVHVAASSCGLLAVLVLVRSAARTAYALLMF